MEIAQEILGISNSATFYLWLEVEDDLQTTIELYRDYNIKVIPGRFFYSLLHGYHHSTP